MVYLQHMTTDCMNRQFSQLSSVNYSHGGMLFVTKILTVPISVKRTDSVQSKRKVSSLSDRSDTSEQGGGGEVSGEESPGILSDDQPPESPSDSNDTDDTSKNMPWLKVSVYDFHRYPNLYFLHYLQLPQ